MAHFRLGPALSVSTIVILLIVTAPGPVSQWAGPSTVPSTHAGGLTERHAAMNPVVASSPVAHRTAALLSPTVHSPLAPPASLWNHSANCVHRWANWNASWADTIPPLDVNHLEQSPCYIGHDEPGLSFLSNQSYSGSRVQFVVQLPPAGTATATVVTTVWVGMWLGGVPCSYRGSSYLEVQLNPPFTDVTSVGSPNWTVQAPVWDLVPQGSCDPQCSNDTAFTTIAAVNYCENDAAIRGVGTYTPTGWGHFHPGDRLNITMVGTVNGTTGLTIYINDTTNLTRSLNWTYSGSVTTTGLPLTPFYNTSSWTSGGWGYGLNVEATWENCPHTPGLPYCDSYNGPAVSAAGVPTFLSVDYWNATTRAYSNPYPWTATTSSAGGCSGLAAPCLNFNDTGGTGQYPYWTLHAWAGKSWWTYGGSYPHEVTNWGGASGQFTPVGFVPVYLDPTTVYKVAASASLSTATVTAAVADPNGVNQVRVGGTWCFSSLTPNDANVSATLSALPLNTPYDGNWSGGLSTNGFTGTLRYWVQAQSSGGVWTPRSYGNVTVGVGSTCPLSASARPTFTAADAKPIGGGYDLNWTENSPGIKNFTLWFNATVNGTPFSVDVGPQNLTSQYLGSDNQSFNVSIVAWNLAGRPSVPTGWTLLPRTLFTLVATWSAATPVLWAPNANVSFTASVVGGLAPYTYRFTWGDGTVGTLVSPNATVTVHHNYGSYWGGARSHLDVWDGLGDTFQTGRAMVQIWATPLGVPQRVAAGDAFVNVTWSTPASPSGGVTHYSVCYTANQSSFLTWTCWPFNGSAPYNMFIWNTTHTYLLIPDPDGVTLYVQVLAWNAYGLGQLPASPALYLNATPAPLLLGPIQASAPGGPAPFNDTFSTTVTGGTFDALQNVVYSFPGGAVVPASIFPGAPSPTGSYTVNASYTFPTPGLQAVTLHVVDAFLDIAIAVSTVSVGPGVGPAVSIGSTLGPLWVGQVVTFRTTVTGGSGAFGVAWDFGDGLTGTGALINHTYAGSGSYGVTAVVTDTGTGGVTVQTETLQVFGIPQVWISTSAGNTSTSYDFSAAYAGGQGGPTFVWTTSNGLIGHGPTFNATFPPGTYEVGVIASDSSGKVAYANVTVDASNPGSSNSGGSTLTGSNAALLVAVSVLAVMFLIGMVYFWSKSRRPPMMMSPEWSESPPPPGAK